jgi:hypothetical protein
MSAMKKLIMLALSGCLLWSCSKGGIGENGLSDEEMDYQKLTQMGTEIKDYAKNKACAGDECRVMSMGSKACGGPTQFIVYSVGKVDEKVLTQKINSYTEYERQLNIKYSRISDCAMIAIPTVDCVNGLCVTK